MVFYLYIKTHNITGLRYLGYTTQDPYKYQGSGKYWIRHLKIHGHDVTTEIIGTYKNMIELKKFGLYYSELYNIVKSKEWANLTEEKGNGGGVGWGENNPNWKKKWPEEYCLKFRGENNPNWGKHHSKEIRDRIAIKNSKSYLIINPHGQSFKITNLNKFCRDNSLSQSNLVRGQWKNWRCVRL